MRLTDKPAVWFRSEIKTPPVSASAREELGRLLRRVQRGLEVTLPHSRPLPDVGRNCHELRVIDADAAWRLIYRIDADAVVVVCVFSKKTRALPKQVKELSRKRLAEYDVITRG